VLLLAIDTSTPAVTAALHDGTRVVAESTEVGARRHGELLAPQVAAVLLRCGVRAADLTDVAVGVGPGPFTGLRVGVVTALTLGAALGIDVHGICSLDALAWASDVAGPFSVVTDARRHEVYWAAYTDRVTRSGHAAVDRPQDVVAVLGRAPVIGPGAGLYAFADARPVQLSAGALAELAVHRLAVGGELLAARPLYLRRPDATVPGARKKVLP
jgi:tRNA threonylcarbamoyl adenosine modification protein YeaZ